MSVEVGNNQVNAIDFGNGGSVSLVGEVLASDGKFKLPSNLESLDFFKVVVEGEGNTGNVWKTSMK